MSPLVHPEMHSGVGQGVPLRIEVGPRDLAKGMCVSARRDRPGREGKAFDVPLEPGAFVAHVRGLLDDVQARRMLRFSAGPCAKTRQGYDCKSSRRAAQVTPQQ